jgi:hypothetical protein
MKKKTPNPYAKKPVCITLHPAILAKVDKRNGNRSEQINIDLARYYLIEEGVVEMDPGERRRFKALAFAGTVHEKLEGHIKQEPKREKPKAAPRPLSPWPT